MDYTFASQNLTAGQLNAIVKKLGGEEGALRFLRDELTVSVAACVFPTWKTITLGTKKSPDEYRRALKSAGHRISGWGDDILGRISCSPDVSELNLVAVSVADLGFKKGAKYSEICTRAKELGLDLCPAEVGPALRLAYNDQPRGEWLRIAMEAITVSDGDRNIFAVDHGYDELWLRGDFGHPEDFWHSVYRFVFLRRK